MTVADAYNCRILFIRNHRIIRQIGRTDVCAHDPPRTLGYVNGDTPIPNGGVLVSEINGSWIDEFGPTGRLMRAFQAPQALIFINVNHHHGRLAVLGNRLWGAPCRLNDFAEAVFGVLHRPTALGHTKMPSS